MNCGATATCYDIAWVRPGYLKFCRFVRLLDRFCSYNNVAAVFMLVVHKFSLKCLCLFTHDRGKRRFNNTDFFGGRLCVSVFHNKLKLLRFLEVIIKGNTLRKVGVELVIHGLRLASENPLAIDFFEHGASWVWFRENVEVSEFAGGYVKLYFQAEWICWRYHIFNL